MNELNLQNKTFFRLIREMHFEPERGVIVVVIRLPTIKKQSGIRCSWEGVYYFRIFTTTYFTPFQIWQREHPVLDNLTFTSFECFNQIWQNIKYSSTKIDRKKILNHE